MKLNEMTNKTIVQTIQKKNRLSWLTETNSAMLDIELYYNRSGEKIVAPIIDGLLNSGKTEEETISILADICLIKYEDKWNRLYNTINADYDVFSDYRKETQLDTNTNQDTQTTIKEDTSTTAKEEKGMYAFNSSESIPTDNSQSETSSISNKATNVLENKANNTGSSTELTTGKLGNTSYQELAKKEVDFRLLHNFIEIFLNDISNELCLSIY